MGILDIISGSCLHASIPTSKWATDYIYQSCTLQSYCIDWVEERNGCPNILTDKIPDKNESVKPHFAN